MSEGTPTAAERKLAAQIAAHTGWAQTPDRTARTKAGRGAFLRRFPILATRQALDEALVAQVEELLGIVRCDVCRRPLTKLRSILKGVGPVCLAKGQGGVS